MIRELGSSSQAGIGLENGNGSRSSCSIESDGLGGGRIWLISFSGGLSGPFSLPWDPTENVTNLYYYWNGDLGFGNCWIESAKGEFVGALAANDAGLVGIPIREVMLQTTDEASFGLPECSKSPDDSCPSNGHPFCVDAFLEGVIVIPVTPIQDLTDPDCSEVDGWTEQGNNVPAINCNFFSGDAPRAMAEEPDLLSVFLPQMCDAGNRWQADSWVEGEADVAHELEKAGAVDSCALAGGRRA